MKIPTFPSAGLLPKHETQAASFITKTSFDGKNTIIAILDTGVDPGAPGLQLTSHGLPKLTHLIDTTGSGDVALEEAQMKDGKIHGLSGRILTLNREWTNPSGKWLVGLKDRAHLLPSTLAKRMSEESKVAFELDHHRLASAIKAAMPMVVVPDQDQSIEEVERGKKIVKEMTERLKVLADLNKAYKEPPVFFDCLVWFDGALWRSVVDTTLDGQIDGRKPMASYHEEHHYEVLSQSSMLNYSVNIYPEDQILSIVTNAGSHGTHVAAITAAFHSSESEENGVAPGAQLISLKIGDTRLGSMETSTGLVRALIELKRLKVDIANISYGEASNLGGRVQSVMQEVIDAGTIVVSSAGNAGAALSTVGAFGGLMDQVIGVGAYVTKGMMEAEYCMLESTKERPFTWSSQGPTIDGDVGVDIFAPGAAITSIPQFNLAKSQLMNGTSMSSPNAAGCVALLVSGMKSLGLLYSPYQVKLALKSTSKDIGDPFRVGFLQVERAFEYLKENSAYVASKVHYKVVGGQGRGIYLRSASSIYEGNLEVIPVFQGLRDSKVNQARCDFEVKVSLRGTHDWIQCPSFLVLSNAGRQFTVRIDPEGLGEGLHCGQIEGFDCSSDNTTPLFSIPVTVCKQTKQLHFKHSFKPGDIHRHFVDVPYEATHVDVIVKSEGRQLSGRFLIHLMQLSQKSRYTTYENVYSLSLLKPDSSTAFSSTRTFNVLGGVPMEICLAQFWSSLDTSNIELELNFHSVLASASSSVAGDYGRGLVVETLLDGFTRIDLRTPLRREAISPKLSYSKVRSSIRSTDQLIRPLGTRDVLPDSKQLHELILTYSFKALSESTYSLLAPKLDNLLYDGYVDNYSLILFDSNKQPLRYQDIYPKSIKLDEGDYTVKIQVTSSDLVLLNDFKSSALVIECALKTALVSTITAEINGTVAIKQFQSPKGGHSVLYMKDELTIPKGVNQGDVLMGKLDLGSLAYGIRTVVAQEFKPKVDAAKEEKDTDKLIYEAVRDTDLGLIKKIVKEERKKAYLVSLDAKYKDDLFYQKDKLTALLAMKEPESIQYKHDSAIHALTLIDQDKVAIYLGTTHAQTDAEIPLKKLNDIQREILQSAYLTLAGHFKEIDATLFDTHLSSLSRWISGPPTEHGPYLLLHVHQQRKLEYYALSLAEVLKYLSGPKSKECYKECSDLKIVLLNDLKWAVWVDYESKWKLRRFPTTFASF